MINEKHSPIKAYRPKQILLIGLGGLGSRTVNKIMSKVPKEFKDYTQAVSIDTDVTDMQRLDNIPVENQITLGSGNTTIGKFMKDNPDTKKWMVQGNALDLIKKRNTKDGAKQIRLVSRIALRATNDQGSLGRKIEQAINKVNAVDGRIAGNGLLVMVVCSIAGGTGAGTVLQVPMYLEDAIRNSYSPENVQFECAMLMPNAFATTLSAENYGSAKVNGYAVLRELMSLNTGRLKRFEYFESHEVDTTDERIAPYGRIMLFDGSNGKGEAITGAADTVHAPLMADALAEYLFGPANGRITSALDNTLKRVYDTDGAGIFGAVGNASLVYPRNLYRQYSVAKWISSTLSSTWLDADIKANEGYRTEIRTARENGSPKPTETSKYLHYSQAVYGGNSVFFKELQRQLISSSEDSEATLADEYWGIVSEALEDKLIKNNTELFAAYDSVTLGDKFTYRKRKGLSAAKDTFRNYYSVLSSLYSGVPVLSREFMRPLESKKPSFFDKDNNDTHISTFLRKHNLHPVALRCFLYDLHAVLTDNYSDLVITNPDEKSDAEWDGILENKKDRDVKVSDLREEMLESAKTHLKSELAKAMMVDLEELILEVEDLFKCVVKVKGHFENASEDCIKELDRLDHKPDTVVAGSTLSMINSWKNIEISIHAGEEGEEDIIDNDLSMELNKLIYKGYFGHVDTTSKSPSALSKDLLRIPTDYVHVLETKLLEYFDNKIKTTYGSNFPENVVDSVRYDCGVKNYWNVLSNNTKDLSIEDFICTDPYNSEYYTLAQNNKLSALSLTETLNRLLSLAIGKSEPRCGLVKIPDTDYTNRYIVMNRGILETKIDYSNVADGETKIVNEESYIIPGVSTSLVEGVNVNACFEGDSIDEIRCLTVYSGLEPSNYTALLAPTSDEDDPQEAMNYYRAYRKYISSVVADPTKITPHLDRTWHIADKLADITNEYTSSVWKHAAKAFVYGFVYDVIQVDGDGTVIFGEHGNEKFNEISARGIINVDFLNAEERALLASDKCSEAQKKDHINAILNHIFVRLTTDPALASAIIDDAEAHLAEDRMFGKIDFIKNASNAENIANIDYSCILDVIDGYYHGSFNAKHIQQDYTLDTAQYMLDILVTTVFGQIEAITSSPLELKTLATDIVDALYDVAVCDDPIDYKVPNTSTSKAKNDIDAARERINLVGEKITSSSATGASQRPFADGGNFSRDSAKRMVEQLLRKSEI